MLNRDAILSADDLKFEDVPVPEWGGSVRIGSMTGAQRDAWEQSLVPKRRGDPVDVTNIRARLVVLCAIDENGKRLFADSDAKALGEKSAAALERLAKVAQKLNGLAEDDVKEAKGN